MSDSREAIVYALGHASGQQEGSCQGGASLYMPPSVTHHLTFVFGSEDLQQRQG
jgi:hypothetical protein